MEDSQCFEPNALVEIPTTLQGTEMDRYRFLFSRAERPVLGPCRLRRTLRISHATASYRPDT